MSANHWRIYCITEDTWSSGYLSTEVSHPTTCFNNTSHTINENSYQLLGVIGEITEVRVISERVRTASGSFRNEGYNKTISTDTTNIIEMQWKKAVNILHVECKPTTDNIGDCVDLIAIPNTTIGILNGDHIIGNTVIHITTMYLSQAKIGYELLINSVVVGEMLSIDTETNEVTIDTPLVSDYSSGLPIAIQIRMIKNYTINKAEDIHIGRMNVGPSYLPANITSHIVYKNNSNLSKQFVFNIEYLY